MDWHKPQNTVVSFWSNPDRHVYNFTMVSYNVIILIIMVPVLIPAAPHQQTSPSVPVSAEAFLSVCSTSSQWNCHPILNSVPIYAKT